MTQDEEHLRLLTIFHRVVAGLTALFATIPVIHLILGLVLILAPEKFNGKGGPPPRFFGWFFVIIASVFITIGWTLAILILIAGNFLAKRKHLTFCLVIAGAECLIMPFGTALGVFTILVLTRDSVKQLFVN